MGEVAADEHDTGRQQGADDAGRPGPGPGGRGSHPAAARREGLRGDREVVLAELGGVSPEAVVRWQKGTAQAFIGYVVEVVSGFDHGHRGY
jgi:hypothetical protein